jgi:hypothetical protein
MSGANSALPQTCTHVNICNFEGNQPPASSSPPLLCNSLSRNSQPPPATVLLHFPLGSVACNLLSHWVRPSNRDIPQYLFSPSGAVSPPTKGTVSGIPYSLSPRANFFLFGDSITQAGSKTEPLGRLPHPFHRSLAPSHPQSLAIAIFHAR